MNRSLAVALLLALSATTAAQQEAPKILVDEGACPFECCQYGRWTASQNIAAFTTTSAKQPALTIRKGQTVTALTGYVRTVGQSFAVTRQYERYKPGDKLMVYTYYGEGMFSVWHNGKRFTEDLGFSPYGGTGGTRCTDSKYCWGTLAGELSSVWWAKLRLQNGKTVWVHGDAGFEGQDACG